MNPRMKNLENRGPTMRLVHSMTFGIYRGFWNQSPTDIKGRPYYIPESC